jgi:hypothetical protein
MPQDSFRNQYEGLKFYAVDKSFCLKSIFEIHESVAKR